MKDITSFLLGLYITTLLCISTLADDWQCYRGPNHDGISKETGWIVIGKVQLQKLYGRQKLALVFVRSQ
jgi:hypothetical protein